VLDFCCYILLPSGMTFPILSICSIVSVHCWCWFSSWGRQASCARWHTFVFSPSRAPFLSHLNFTRHDSRCAICFARVGSRRAVEMELSLLRWRSNLWLALFSLLHLPLPLPSCFLSPVSSSFARCLQHWVWLLSLPSILPSCPLCFASD